MDIDPLTTQAANHIAGFDSSCLLAIHINVIATCTAVMVYIFYEPI